MKVITTYKGYKIYAGVWEDYQFTFEGMIQTVKEAVQAGYKKIIIKNLE